ncbi:MAG TPA: sigma-70 family RNA polymerase sigma factor [Chthonomonadaceae bacterium]|nr:sigma-70 family RNA polymerase sigma factor [Chthonomonadaceae bacterium]
MNETSARQKEFEALLRPIMKTVYSAALHYTRNPEDASDLVQEATLQAFRAFDSFQRGTNFRAWLLRILTNLFLNKYRKQQREPDTANIEDLPESYLYHQAHRAGLHQGGDPAEIVLEKLDTEKVTAAIDALPEEFRIVATLYFVEEFSYQDIAEIVDCPVGTVRSRLHRSRKLLQKALWEQAMG